MSIYILHGTYHFGRRKIGVRKDFCNACERECLSELWRSFNCHHVFWIPLLPVGSRERWLCALCHCDPRARYRTGKPMKVAGLVASAIFLAAMIVTKPNPAELDAGFLWGLRIFFALVFLGLLYSVLKRNPVVTEDARRKAVVPLGINQCVYCKGPLQSQPHLHCPACQIRVYVEIPPRTYSIDSILALPPDEAMKTLVTELHKMPRLHTKAEFNVSIVQGADYSIADDGLNGWFLNANPQELRDTYEAFVAVGAKRTAETIKKAMGIFPRSEPPDDFREYDNIVSHMTPEQKAMFNELDHELYELGLKHQEDLEALMYQYVVNNIKDFRESTQSRRQP